MYLQTKNEFLGQVFQKLSYYKHTVRQKGPKKYTALLREL